MKQPKISISDVPNWIMAIMSITALVVSIVALKQTDTSNHLAQLMYEKSEKPSFRVKTEYPDGFVPTNHYQKALIRNVRLTNVGAPVSELNSVQHIPLLHVTVFDRDKPELSPHMANKIVLRSFYEEGTVLYNSEGELYSAEGSAKQKLIAHVAYEYAKAHPERKCAVQMLDLFKIEYTDALGQRHEYCMLQGCQTSPKNFSRLWNDAEAFCEKARKTGETFDNLLDYCYELSKTENKAPDATK